MAKSVLFDRDDLTVQEQGAGSTYTVRLGRAPSGTVTVAITATGGAGVTVYPTSLTFTTGNWGTERTVTVRGATLRQRAAT